jgi:hypothetical protein
MCRQEQTQRNTSWRIQNRFSADLLILFPWGPDHEPSGQVGPMHLVSADRATPSNSTGRFRWAEEYRAHERERECEIGVLVHQCDTERWNSVRSQQPKDVDRASWPFGSELRSNAQDAAISQPLERDDLKIKPNEVYLAYAPQEGS